MPLRLLWQAKNLPTQMKPSNSIRLTTARPRRIVPSEIHHGMTDQSSLLEQTVAHHSAPIAQINEILLLIARRQQESDPIQQETIQIQQANAQQIAANAQAIAELRATLQDRYSANGQRGE